ncbi:PAS domain-containing protein [Isoalcanivorax indicus]|uniref:PAS domain-containing protein n=1 Tax=Isoalcanivorax indicus TaxID=2202653 RepID=UPI0013C42A22|nr:PAS domain-containing protein [Isoalcanivorax indicus]
MAETRLKTGTAQQAGSYSLGLDALKLLHDLSSNPDTASDALKLLHELQVHQVEIDLQNEVIQSGGHLLADELAHYKALYEGAPVGYFVVDLQGGILQANPTGAALLDTAPDTLCSGPFDRFLAADSQPVLATILSALRQGRPGQGGEVFTSSARRLHMAANLSPDTRCALLVCSEVS